MLLFVSWLNKHDKYAITEWPLFDAPETRIPKCLRMRQQVPMVFLLFLVYLGTVTYISEEISSGSFWRRDILRVKGQALFTNCNFL